MIKVSAFLFWTLAEVALALFVVLLGLVIYLWWRRRRDYKAARRLIVNVKGLVSQREAEMKRILSEDYGYAEDRVEETNAILRKGEMAVYKALLRAYLKHDSRFLTQWYQIFIHAVAPYRSLEVPKGQGHGLAQAQEMDSSELDALRRKNQELTDELRVTMDTMGRVLGEYSGMFAQEEENNDVVLVIDEKQIAKPLSAQDDLAAAFGPTGAIGGDDLDWGSAMAEQAAAEAGPEAAASEAEPADGDLDWGAALAEQAAAEAGPEAAASEAEPAGDDLDWGAALAEQAAAEAGPEAAASETEPAGDDLDWGAALAEQAAAEAGPEAAASEAEPAGDDLDWGAALAEQAAGEAKSEEEDDLDWGAALAEQAEAEAKGK